MAFFHERRRDMPLAFESISHGTIAFGFFNIKTDMLLLENCFFFASDFCWEITRLARLPMGSPLMASWEGYTIPSPEIGDLHGAISGTRLTGFIGEVYRLFPFPAFPENFRQDPDGYRNRPIIEETISRFGSHDLIYFNADIDNRRVRVGEYHFTIMGFHELLHYVWRGGYPRWKGEKRPLYVLRMKEAMERSSQPLFRGQ